MPNFFSMDELRDTELMLRESLGMFAFSINLFLYKKTSIELALRIGDNIQVCERNDVIVWKDNGTPVKSMYRVPSAWKRTYE